MSWFDDLLIFVISLPLNVWLLAQLGALFDGDQRSRYLVRAIGSFCVLLIFLLLTDRSWWVPVAFSFALVLFGHTLGLWLILRYGTGVAIHPAGTSSTRRSGHLDGRPAPAQQQPSIEPRVDAPD